MEKDKMALDVATQKAKQIVEDKGIRIVRILTFENQTTMFFRVDEQEKKVKFTNQELIDFTSVTGKYIDFDKVNESEVLRLNIVLAYMYQNLYKDICDLFNL